MALPAALRCRGARRRLLWSVVAQQPRSKLLDDQHSGSDHQHDDTVDVDFGSLSTWQPLTIDLCQGPSERVPTTPLPSPGTS